MKGESETNEEGKQGVKGEGARRLDIRQNENERGDRTEW